MSDLQRELRDADIVASSSAHCEGAAVFYSGPGNEVRADKFAQSSRTYTIKDTEMGIRLNSDENGAARDLYADYDDNRRADNMMRGASRKFAHEANGNVHTFVVGAREDRIFRSEELPILLQNERVKTINGVSRHELVEMNSRDAAFHRICEAELQRDQDRIAQNPAARPEERLDLWARKAHYHEQMSPPSSAEVEALGKGSPDLERDP